MIHAIVRRVSRSLADCELTHLPRQKIDLNLAHQQHETYVLALMGAGVRVTILEEEPNYPDAAFVEDMAVILPEVIVIGRSGCPSRRPESETLLPVLSRIGDLHPIQPPGTLEGGDVLVSGRTLFAGLSGRSNEDGIRQLEAIVRHHDYRVVRIGIEHCLHLKTAVTVVATGVLLANPGWVDTSVLCGHKILPVPEVEPWGANTLLVNGRLFVAQSAPRTADLLRAWGYNAVSIDISELQKAEAGLTCLSLLYGD